MGCHSLLQGIFSTQGSKLCLLYFLHWPLKWRFLPSKYEPGPTLLSFRDQKRSGAFRVVWQNGNSLPLSHLGSPNWPLQQVYHNIFSKYTGSILFPLCDAHTVTFCLLFSSLYTFCLTTVWKKRGKKSITAYFIQFLKAVTIWKILKVQKEQNSHKVSNTRLFYWQTQRELKDNCRPIS